MTSVSHRLQKRRPHGTSCKLTHDADGAVPLLLLLCVFLRAVPLIFMCTSLRFASGEGGGDILGLLLRSLRIRLAVPQPCVAN
jgi:hypothetical protein